MFKFKISQVSALLICFFLIACGGGGSDGGTESKTVNDKVATTSNEVTSVFSGSVIDGPVIGATLKIYDKSGNLLKTEITDENARYSTRITAQEEAYPLTIEVTGGTDLVTEREVDFKLVSVVTDSSVTNSNVNPFSTLIVESARSMAGGLNNGNLNKAKNFIINNMNFGLDSQLVSDPISSEINDLNIGVIVKSSEAFAEMIRRTHATLINTDTASNMDEIVKALAADMTDGLLDGIGGTAAHKRIAAVSTLVSGKVLIETLSNNLSVDGTNATSRMDDAIKAVNPQAPLSSMTGKVRINEAQLQQARASINASITLLPNTNLSAIADLLKTLETDSLPADIEALLPASAGGNIDDSIVAVSIATETEIDQFNRILMEFQGNRVTVNFNRLPSITGVPASAVYENTSYRFAPTATDSDADLLTYSISNKPSWASFDRATGVLTGAPQNSDIGITSNIKISVSDGISFAVSLAEFSITVESTTALLSWVAPTTNADSSPLSLSEIKGYKIYTGTDANNLTLLFDTDDPTVNEHTIRNLEAAKHYYAITTYNQSEIESDFSVLVSKTINSL